MTTTTNGVAAELERARRALAALVHHVGTPGECRGCREAIVWIPHRNGKRVPYNPDGINHFATCPEALKFKTKG
jgi:hypothetical protein